MSLYVYNEIASTFFFLPLVRLADFPSFQWEEQGEYLGYVILLRP